MDRKRYSQDLLIPCYDTDAVMLLKPSSFMDLAQEAANRHATVLGFGYDEMMVSRTAWVLSRMHVKFVRHPKWRERVNLTTWHKGPERLFYLRDFRMTDSQGKPLVLATTSWLVLNIDSRRIIREVPQMDGEDTVCRENAIAESCGKVQIPSCLLQEAVCEHVVSYSDIDMNGHTNNAMYLVWAMDAVDYGTASARPLKEMRINFNQETRPGDNVSIYKAREITGDEITYYVEGKVNGRSAFCVELKF